MLFRGISSLIFITKRRSAMEIFPESLTKLWDEWEVRALVLISLFLQTVLILLGNRRKYISGSWIRIIIWLSYLTADWIAVFCIGVISNHQGDCEESSSQQIMVLAFWAPFLLLHLGGPDTITAYSLEDNELWLRHLLGLIVQFVGSFYIFLRSWKGVQLNFLAIPIFVAGLIKYGERTWVLRSAGSIHFRRSMLPHPDPGPNYPKIMREYTLKSSQGYNVSFKPPVEPSTNVTCSHPPEQDNMTANLRDAYCFFSTFKRLFADLILTFQDLEHSRSLFEKASPEKAFKVIEIELGFVYDVLYTKANLSYSRCGGLLRLISLSLTVSSFLAFLLINKYDYSTIDLIITYLLLVGAIVLEIYAIIVLLSSDWTKLWLSARQQKSLLGLIYGASSCCPLRFLLPQDKRWSDSMAQFNLLSFCLKEKPIKLPAVEISHTCEMLEKLYYSNSTIVPPDLKRLIFQHLLKKSSRASDINARKELCAGRGDLVLKEMDCYHIFGWSVEEDFDQSILLWHIATDLCCYTDQNQNPECKFSKLLSDYMLYLLVMCPFLLPDGIGEMRFRDSCAEIKRFFQDDGTIESRLVACEKLLEVNTDIPALEVKGDKSKSVVFDACRLAKDLKSPKTPKKWELMSEVWVEMLCYAASQCGWKEHGQQLRRGGELLTHVWLLMAHFGISEHFKISRGHETSVLVVN